MQPLKTAPMDSQIARLEKLMIHYVGNKTKLDDILVSDHPTELDDDTTKILRDQFLNRFKYNEEYHAFAHPSSLQFNEVYQYCQSVFTDTTSFEEASDEIARHLYQQSVHPKVKGGELYVCLFEGLPVESRNYKAIGIFKTETKSLFLQTKTAKNRIELNLQEGIEPGRVDKGCLVINRNAAEGFDVLIFDNQNRGEEAQYWKEKFLGLEPQKNEFHHTAHLMTLTKKFITGPLDSEEGIERTEQVEMLKKSLDYFKGNDSFDIEEYQETVFQSEERIQAFRDFGSRYVEQHNYDIAASFDISPDAVKKQSRIFKSVLKLDKNFHIYIHGRTDLIEKGTDESGRKFYKIYYQEEQ